MTEYMLTGAIGAAYMIFMVVLETWANRKFSFKYLIPGSIFGIIIALVATALVKMAP